MKTNSYTLLNAEGDILTIIFEKDKITAKVLLDDGSGKISFKIRKFEIIKYLHSEITLNELLKNSTSKKMQFFDYETKVQIQIDKKNVPELACGNIDFNSIHWDMKMPFQKRIELAVRANYIPLCFKKIMEIIKHYFYLREKYELLKMLKYSDSHPALKKCLRQLGETRDYLFKIQMPFEFISKKEIDSLRLGKVCLKEEFGLDLVKIGQKDILVDISNREMNYLVYKLSDLIVDLRDSPRFWSKKAKLKYIEEYKDHYCPFKRNIIINNVLN